MMAYDKNATPLSEVPQIQLANEINRIDEWLNTDENKPNEIRHAGNAAYITTSYSLLIIPWEHDASLMSLSVA